MERRIRKLESRDRGGEREIRGEKQKDEVRWRELKK